MPCLAKKPFSLATNSGAASVSAMKPRLAFLISGPAACAICAPAGNAIRIDSVSATAEAVAAERRKKVRRESGRGLRFFGSVMARPCWHIVRDAEVPR